MRRECPRAPRREISAAQASFYVFQAWWLIATGGVMAVTLVAALSGVDVARCLVILMLAPTITIVGSEVRVLVS